MMTGESGGIDTVIGEMNFGFPYVEAKVPVIVVRFLPGNDGVMVYFNEIVLNLVIVFNWCIIVIVSLDCEVDCTEILAPGGNSNLYEEVV